MPAKAITEQPPTGGLSLEKVRSAARRMGVGLTTFYSIVKRGELQIIKVGERSAAVVSSEVDAWIQKRIDQSRGVAK